jgi:3-oxoacyl-[acyl-carrier-protein] synthase II
MRAGGDAAMSYRDQAGRPVVVVTGLGVVTSLGTGKADNWRKLTSGASGIHAITRFPTDALKTRIAGTVDFIPVDQIDAQSISQRLAEIAATEAVAESGISARADFPGPLSQLQNCLARAAYRTRGDREYRILQACVG